MMHRFAYLYGPVDSFDLRALLNYFSSSGITLSNPANGRITALTSDGEQADITLDMLSAAVSSQDPITFQLWMPNHADVCCRIRYLTDNRLVEEYTLVGFHPNERSHVLNVLVERFRSKAQHERQLFFVGDPEGYSIDVDWDKLALTGKYEPRVCPDFLGIPIERLGDFERCRETAYEFIPSGKYLILRNTLNQKHQNMICEP